MRPGFRLTPENEADVVAICRRLDGLPLAIELSCLTDPRAEPEALLLGRLDQALDIASTSRLVPERQRTLRDTIAWSYDLLTPPQQGLFRRLGVFAGGGDLDAVAAVMADPDGADLQVDPLDAVADLVDASLAKVTEGPDGEPRMTLLETIRVFAQEQLRAAHEVDAARATHARHFAEVAERLRDLRESRHTAALGLAETELDNFREALEWAVPRQGDGDASTGDLATGLRLCGALGWVWWTGGYIAEGRGGTSGSSPGRPARVAAARRLPRRPGEPAARPGEPERAHDLAAESLAMARSLGDRAARGVRPGRPRDGRSSITGRRRRADDPRGDRGAAPPERRPGEWLAPGAGQPRRRRGDAGPLRPGRGADRRSRWGSSTDLGDVHEAVVQAAEPRQPAGGQPDGSRRPVRWREGSSTPVLQLRSPNLTMAFANTYMNILIRLGDPVRAAQLFGAEEAMRERLGIPNPFQDEELEEAIDLWLADVMSAEEWNRHRRLGRAERVEDLLARLGSGSSADHRDAVPSDQEGASP